MTNAPIKNFKDGWFSAGIFQSEYDGKPSYQVSIKKGFKRKGSDTVEYQSISCFAEDLLKVATLCERAYWAIMEKKEADYRANAGGQTPRQAKKVAPAPAPVRTDDEIPF